MNASSTHDHFMPVAAIEDVDETWDPDEVVEVEGEPMVPFRCRDCGRPAYYDTETDDYHHAVDPATGCFLIPCEDRPDDTTHPLVHA